MFTVLRLRKPSLKWVFTLAILLALTLGGFGYIWAVKTVTIVDADRRVEIRTFAKTVEELLHEQGITYDTEDLVRPTPSTSLKENMTITIARAIPIKVQEKGESKTVYVAEPTVAKVLSKANVALSPLDIVEHNLDLEGEKEKYVTVTHVEEKTIEETNQLDFPVKREPDKFLPLGQTKLLQAGEKGIVKETIVVTLVDGEEVKREVVNKEVVKEPKPQIIAYGTKNEKPAQTSRGLSGREALLMEATAYTHTGNKTATGVNPHHGVIAVDPKVIPLGTELYVEGYGYGKALDTGGAIKGHRIDLFFETKAETINWGRRNVQVYILE